MNHQLSINITLLAKANHSGNNSTGYNSLPLFLHILNGFIAVLSVIFNTTVMALLWRGRQIQYIYTSYDLLIINMAIADLSIGILIFVTPEFVIPANIYPFPSGIIGDIFCRIVVSEYWIFVFGFYSVAIIAFISLERWMAIAKPIIYRHYCRARNAKIALPIIFVINMLFKISNIANIHYSNNTVFPCVWQVVFPATDVYVYWFTTSEILTFFFPIAIILYANISIGKWSKIRSPSRRKYNIPSHRRRKMSKMVMAASIALLICWLPNEIYFTLRTFKMIPRSRTFHRSAKILVLLNSTLNPIIYVATNRSYRNSIVDIVHRASHYTFMTKQQSPSSDIACVALEEVIK